MKLVKFLLIMTLSVPLAALAQYSGGQGRGDVMVEFAPQISTGLGSMPSWSGTLRPFPNPATDHFRLMPQIAEGWTAGRVELLDLSGRKVAEWVAGLAGGDQFSLVGQAPGLYMVRVIAESGKVMTMSLVVSD